jgi:hypothetical protein
VLSAGQASPLVHCSCRAPRWRKRMVKTRPNIRIILPNCPTNMTSTILGHFLYT